MKRAVVKLGGSLAADAAMLDEWVAALAASASPLVIVPGGGPFADQVRDAQQRIGFSDRAAHAMAIVAMDQFGYVILDRDDRLEPARSLQEIERVLSEGKVPVWLPSSIAIQAGEVPAKWDITSDSLAAWFAGKLRADALLLVKQTDAFSSDDDVSSLTARGVVDAGLAGMLPPEVVLHLACAQDIATARTDLSAGTLPGMAIHRARTHAREAG